MMCPHDCPPDSVLSLLSRPSTANYNVCFLYILKTWALCCKGNGIAHMDKHIPTHIYTCTIAMSPIPCTLTRTHTHTHTHTHTRTHTHTHTHTRTHAHTHTHVTRRSSLALIGRMCSCVFGTLSQAVCPPSKTPRRSSERCGVCVCACVCACVCVSKCMSRQV